MRIKDLYKDHSTIIPVNNNYYNSRDWYLQSYNLMDRLIRSTQGNRVIFEDLETWEDVKTAIDDLFVFNRYKYDHLWKLYVAEYNPLWNVDGTEHTIRDRKNSGTQESAASGTDTVNYNGSETMAKTGYDDNVQTGNIKEQNGGALTSGRTTFDSGTFLDTDKETDSRDTTTTYNNKSDKMTYNSTDTHSFNNRNDETDYGRVDTRTDDLHEHEEIMHIRGGNIGVTMTTQLEADELKFVKSFNFIQTLISDIANHISYVW